MSVSYEAPSTATESDGIAKLGETSIITDLFIKTRSMGDILVSWPDSARFKKIIDLYEKRLYGFAWQMVRSKSLTTNLVSDLVQHAWTQLFLTVVRGQEIITLVDQGDDGQDQLCRWLLVVIHNKATDYWREQQVLISWEKVGEKEEWNNQRFESMDARLLREDLSTTLERIMKRYLSERQLKVIRLLFFEQLTITQVSLILDMPENTVKSHRRRAIEQLRKGFMEQNITLEDLAA